MNQNTYKAFNQYGHVVYVSDKKFAGKILQTSSAARLTWLIGRK